MQNSLDALPNDTWLSIAAALRGEPVALFLFAQTCRTARSAVAQVTHAVRLPAVPRWLNQGDLCAALFLSPEEARRLPFRVESNRRSGGGHYDTHWFDMHSTIPRFLKIFGGWRGLKQRMDARAEKKRKRSDLEDRREEAAAKRRALMDEWISMERPLGAEVDSVDSWVACLRRRQCNLPTDHPVLGRFLGTSALTGPPLAAAKEAALEFEAAQSRLEEKRAAAARRKAEVVEVLTIRGYEMDESLHIAKVFNSFGYVSIHGLAAPEVLGVAKATVMAQQIIEEIKQKARREAEERERERVAAENRANEERQRAQRAAESKARRIELVSHLRRVAVSVKERDPYVKEMFASYQKDGLLCGKPTTAVEVAEQAQTYLVRSSVLERALVEAGLAGCVLHDVVDERRHYARTGALRDGTPMTCEGVVQWVRERQAEHKRRECVRTRPPGVDLFYWNSFNGSHREELGAWCQTGNWMQTEEVPFEQILVFLETLKPQIQAKRRYESRAKMLRDVQISHTNGWGLFRGEFRNQLHVWCDTGTWMEAKNVAVEVIVQFARTWIANRNASSSSSSASAAPTAAGDRRCTHPGCKNPHKQDNPPIGLNGPVCGRCARLCSTS